MKTRQATKSDVRQMFRLLNRIIEIGGTTAYEEKLDDEKFTSHFLNEATCLSLYVCESNDSEILGFQVLKVNTSLPAGWADIATFARVEPKVRGVGITLFEATKKLAREREILAINATIRGDNESGLAYYSKIGFVNYKVDKARPLKDGTPVDRISKKYVL